MFKLNDRLNNDTIELCDLNICKVLLMNDETYPWIILVPKVADICELHHMSFEDQTAALKDINIASKIMEDHFSPKSLNVAALGNVVTQLHIHIVARFETDPTWPGPIWGKLPPVAYKTDERKKLLQDAFSKIAI